MSACARVRGSGLKSAVLGYYRWSEFQTRAAVRLLPLVACHYFDDWGVCSPDFDGGAQDGLRELARLFGVNLEMVRGRSANVAAKVEPPALVRKLLGVVFDFKDFRQRGVLKMSVPEARITKIREMCAAA